MSEKPQTPAVLYAAKSTEDPHGSIETQLEDCRSMAAREGFEVVDQFRDKGFSAYHGNRGPGLEDAKRVALAAAEEFGEAMLVVQHSDRLARGAGDAPGAADHLGELYFWARRHNIRLRSVQDDSNLEDAVRAVLIGERNTEDSRRKSEATRAGKRRRAERGDSTGPVPFGYELEPVKDGEGKVVVDQSGKPMTTGRRVPESGEAAVVRRIFALLDGGKGIGEITRWVNAHGVRTKRDNAFGRSRVREILRNPWYGGKVLGYGVIRDGNHEALLPWSEFDRISSKLDRGKAPAGTQPGDAADPVAASARRGGRPSEIALLSGVMFCAHCGHRIWHRKGGRRRYVCGNVRHATGICSAAPFDAQLTEEAVLNHLMDLFLDFDAWLEGVTQHRLSQREAYERTLAGIDSDRQGLTRDERLVRKDYVKHLRAGNERATEFTLGELSRIADDMQRVDEEAAQAEAALAEHDRQDAADDMLDFWNQLSAAVRDEIVNAESVREANGALRERFAAIYVSSPPGGPPRLDFILRDREPGAPLVSSALWTVDPEDPNHAGLLEGWQAPGASGENEWTDQSGRLIKVNRCLAEGRARLRQAAR